MDGHPGKAGFQWRTASLLDESKQHLAAEQVLDSALMLCLARAKPDRDYFIVECRSGLAGGC
jgi:hypothetical protein